MEKARVYLSLDKGENGSVATISKGKNWVNPEENPNGRKIKYWVFKGAKVKQQTNYWYKEGAEDFSIEETMNDKRVAKILNMPYKED